MIQIIPAILATSEDQYQKDLQKLSSCEPLKGGWVHIDLADNKFVQNKTVGPEVVQKFPTNFLLEAHLMVENPLSWIDQLIQAGFERVIFHLESNDDTDECINKIKEHNLEVGIALKKETPIEKLAPFVDKIDVVLIMTIVPGFQGQPLIPQTLIKVREIKSKNWPVKVGVDGAVSDVDVKEVVASGIDFMIVGSFLLKGDTEENLEKLWEIING